MNNILGLDVNGEEKVNEQVEEKITMNTRNETEPTLKFTNSQRGGW
jgi:hypothetical protein